MKELGIECEEITSDTLKREFGKPMNVIADHLFPSASAAEKERALELCCMYEHEVLERCEENLLYPGVKETIQELAKTHKVCVVSNCQSGYIELFLKKNQLEQYVLDTECYGDTKKSKGENIRLVIERNHLQNCVYVGATAEDVRLMKSLVGDEIRVKAAGGIRDLDNAFTMIEAGAERIGTSAGVKIVEELRERIAAEN